MASRPLTSLQWFARMTAIIALGASEVVVARVAGVTGWRLAGLAVLGAVFVLAYLVTPSPGKPKYEPSARRPVLVIAFTTVAGVVITGGLTSPLMPLLACPYVLGWTMFRPDRADLLLGAIPIAGVLGLWLVTGGHAGLAPPDGVLLRAWSAVLAFLLVGRGTAQLFESVHSTHGYLARVRDGALHDAAARRRGLESMTTKLAHELKNPLAAIRSLVQVQLQQVADDKTRRRLDVVLAETERMGTILREYIELARPGEDLELDAIELGDLMSEVSALLDGRADVAGVTLVFGGGGGRLHADRRLLKEAIVNLVCNALEATPRGGSITVSHHLGDAGASISIRDTGAGMSAEIAARVGTPFFTTRTDGTGLGVAIARSAIAQHHGKLSYSSTPGIGTIAMIALPIDPRHKQKVAA